MQEKERRLVLLLDNKNNIREFNFVKKSVKFNLDICQMCICINPGRHAFFTSSMLHLVAFYIHFLRNGQKPRHYVLLVSTICDHLGPQLLQIRR